MYSSLRSTLRNRRVFFPAHELSALETMPMWRRRIVTKRPLDLFDSNKIHNELGGSRNITFLVVSGDPRDLVSSVHPSMPHQYFQSADYQLEFGKNGAVSLSRPGIIPCASEIDDISADRRFNVIEIRYEDFLDNPQTITRSASQVLRLPSHDPASLHGINEPGPLLKDPLPTHKAAGPQGGPSWLEPSRLHRAFVQISLFPEIEKIATAFGYPPFEEVLDRTDTPKPDFQIPTGTIIAYHTDDGLYRSEAQRFYRSVQNLRLPLQIEEIPASRSWVAACAYKPEFVLAQRKSLRGPLLYTDVDSVVHADPWPYLAQYDGDVAVSVLPDGTLNSGTIWINDTLGAREILLLWACEQRRSGNELDQEVLRRIVSNIESQKIEGDEKCPFRIQRLPYNFCYIFDRAMPFYFGCTYIEHLQASRESPGKSEKAAPESIRRRRQRVRELTDNTY